jgi:hypothetical protein
MMQMQCLRRLDNDLSKTAIYFGYASTATAVHPLQIYFDAATLVLIMKVDSESVGRPTTFMDLTPSAFYDFASADAPAKHIFYNPSKVLNAQNLPKSNIFS